MMTDFFYGLKSKYYGNVAEKDSFPSFFNEVALMSQSFFRF